MCYVDLVCQSITFAFISLICVAAVCVFSQVWKLGHVFPEEDVDIGDAVNAVWLEMEQARRQQEPY